MSNLDGWECVSCGEIEGSMEDFEHCKTCDDLMCDLCMTESGNCPDCKADVIDIAKREGGSTIPLDKFISELEKEKNV